MFFVVLSVMYIIPFSEKINLGLDLKGGMYLILKADTSKVFRKLVSNKKTFDEGKLEKLLKGEILLESKDNKKEVIWTVITEEELRSKLAKTTLSDRESIVRIWQQSAKRETHEAIKAATEVIRNRIDEFGVKEATIQIQGSDALLVQLPGEVDRDRALSLIGKTAFLEFRLVSEDGELLKKALAGEEVEGYELKHHNEKPLLLEKEAPVTGADLDSAQSSFDASMLPVVTLNLNGEGRKKFANLTKEHVGERLAIVLDGVVKSAPAIREPILDGSAQISGDFTVAETQDLALVLKAGALPCPLKVEEERTVGPLLGSDSIRRGLNSIVMGACLVVLFMLIYYLTGGMIAFLCIGLDLLFILAGLSLLGATLTLPGIAGMILTLGMAVDGNVLIFERIREELELKKPLSLAVKNGFDRARRTIFDANLTTLIAACFLFIYGTGPIRGFATTLMLGIIASIFTAVFIGRMIFTILLNKGVKQFRMLKLLAAPRINFVALKNMCIMFSLVLIAIGMGSFSVKGDSIFGIDFKGGQVLEYQIMPPVSIQKVRDTLQGEDFKDIVLQEFKDVKGGIIVESKGDITEKIETTLRANFDTVNRLGVNTIGPSVGVILRKKAFLAVLLSLVGILVYVAFRFKHFDFALAAVIAIFHDVLISIGFIALFGYEITLLTITALLTIAGYSVNDTIVIYDRIRELTPKMFKRPFREVINTAINQTLSRTIITSFTTILVVICMFVLGGQALKGFSFALLVGFLAGTYSSVYIASPLVLLFRKSRRHSK